MSKAIQLEIHNKKSEKHNENGNYIYKKIMATIAGVTRRKNARYGNEFPLTSNGIQAAIHNRKSVKHSVNGHQTHKKIMPTYAGVTHRKNDRYGNEFPLMSKAFNQKSKTRNLTSTMKMENKYKHYGNFSRCYSQKECQIWQ
jgi:hypothetical protein